MVQISSPTLKEGAGYVDDDPLKLRLRENGDLFGPWYPMVVLAPPLAQSILLTPGVMGIWSGSTKGFVKVITVLPSIVSTLALVRVCSSEGMISIKP